jgi:membrane-associated phospholipid phosphatase
MLAARAALLVAAVAASRVLLGVHYPSAVAGGVALDVAWVSAAALLVSLPRNVLSPTSVSRRPLVKRIEATNDRPP